MPEPLPNRPVLIVEDDRNTAQLIATYLEREGFTTRQVHDGQQALELARESSPGFVILDIMLPGRDGWELCRELRRTSNVPILMLTAREEEIDRVLGLSLGADDYVVKPFSPRELVERVKAILRRSSPPPESTTLQHGLLQLDTTKRRVLLADEPLELTAVEYKLLEALMRSPGKVFTRTELLEHIYPRGETVVEKTIDVHIGHLRQKLGDNPGQPSLIHTIRGFGYRFADRDERSST